MASDNPRENEDFIDHDVANRCFGDCANMGYAACVPMFLRTEKHVSRVPHGER